MIQGGKCDFNYGSDEFMKSILHLGIQQALQKIFLVKKFNQIHDLSSAIKIFQQNKDEIGIVHLPVELTKHK